jgi:hypothetical protein
VLLVGRVVQPAKALDNQEGHPKNLSVTQSDETVIEAKPSASLYRQFSNFEVAQDGNADGP